MFSILMKGNCDICGKKGELTLKIYKYHIKCDCCKQYHQVRIWHCENCKPKPPEKINVLLKGENFLAKEKEE